MNFPSPCRPIAVLVLGLLVSIPAAASGVTFVGCPNVSVGSLDRSIAFYTGVLQFTFGRVEDSTGATRLQPGVPATTVSRTARLTLGDECIELTQYDSPEGRRFPADSHGNDLWFQHIAIVVSDMDRAYARLREMDTKSVSNLPQVLPASNKSAAGVAAFYFRDPDGHYLELIHFPIGKGQMKWQAPSSRLFLGIDHTAIVVADTAKSLQFYEHLLGLRVVGGSENVGLEQEHLSGVFNAHVVITSLRAGAGIGLELLSYVTPTDGRTIPTDREVADLDTWLTLMRVNDDRSDPAAELLRESDWKRLPTLSQGGSEAAWIKDPDSHIVELVK